MKNIFKSLIAIGVVFMFTIILTGCGKEEEKPEIEKPQENNSEQNVEEQKESNEEYDIKLYSDDTKMVFNFSDVYYVTYYYSGDKITGLEYVYDCKDITTAEYTMAAIQANYEQEDNIKSVERKGKYVVVAWTEEEYKNQTVEDIKNTYSYLEQVYKDK